MMPAIYVPLRTVVAEGLFAKRAQGSLPQTEQYPMIFLPQFRNKVHTKDIPECVTNRISKFTTNLIFSRYSYKSENKHICRNYLANSKSLCRYNVPLKKLYQ